MSSILELEHLHPTHPAHSKLRAQAERMTTELTERIRHLSLVPPIEPEPQPTLKLTRRGRLAMFVSTVLMLVVLAVILGSNTAATDQPGAPVPATMVTVEPGQTLWDIAGEANPNGDVQDTVSDIMRLNSIESAGGLQAGDTIAVPLYK
ncbi:MAG: LysM peptidoglycan-binding domain-containing protein [Aeromicrobium sp.]